ncbi:MAG: ribosome hibernation-promoting factor, HPF/YfiA family [bacterium]
MTLNIQTRNIELSSAIENYIEKKITRFERILRRGYDKANVEIWNEKHRYIVELSIKAGHRAYRGRDETADLRTSIDGAFDKVEKQIRRQKGRFLPKKSIEEYNIEEKYESEEPDVIIQNIQYKPMTLDEARLQFESMEVDFFVYIDALTSQVNVLYKRKDGKLCVIKPL